MFSQIHKACVPRIDFFSEISNKHHQKENPTNYHGNVSAFSEFHNIGNKKRNFDEQKNRYDRENI